MSISNISNIQDLVDIHEFMDSAELTEAMEIAVKCIARPDMPPAVARKALLKMQAFAFQFKMQAMAYTYLHKGKAGTQENIKKNIFFSASSECHELAQTLKYLVRDSS